MAKFMSHVRHCCRTYPELNEPYAHCRCASDERLISYRYNILERVLVENIIRWNVIINRGTAEVDNDISRDDFFD